MRADLLNSPNAVLAVLGASAVVCAGVFTLEVTRIMPLLGHDDTAPRVETASAALGSAAIAETPIRFPDAIAAGPERLMPTALPPASAGNDYQLAAPLAESEAAPTIIAGRPPVEAIPRPAHIVALARSIREPADPTAIADIRPATRPEALNTEPAPQLALASTATGLLSSPRPAERPADLDTTPAQVEVARTEQPQATYTLAAAPAASEEPIQLFGRNDDSCSRRLSRAIPRRPGNAAGGQSFVSGLGEGSGPSRDTAIVRELARGNVPNFMRQLVPVSFTGVLANGRSAQITICVTPDYLALGSDQDFVRVPLGLPAAGQIAEAFNMMLPTTRMVDAIYAQADLRLSPSPMTPGSQMSSTSYFMRHNATVDGQYRNAGGRLGMLVSGHKKDVVLTNRLARSPGRIAIYGWHRRSGNPIQPLSTVHGAEYADYSHGIRLVSRTAYVNGRAMDLQDLLMDGTYAGLLNSEGAISRPAIQIASR